jgi:hypothetical protein
MIKNIDQKIERLKKVIPQVQDKYTQLLKGDCPYHNYIELEKAAYYCTPHFIAKHTKIVICDGPAEVFKAMERLNSKPAHILRIQENTTSWESSRRISDKLNDLNCRYCNTWRSAMTEKEALAHNKISKSTYGTFANTLRLSLPNIEPEDFPPFFGNMSFISPMLMTLNSRFIEAEMATKAGLIVNSPNFKELQEMQKIFAIITYKGVAFVCKAPKKIHYKYEEVLIPTIKKQKSASIQLPIAIHNENGPAMEFKDGTKIYAYNGVRIPKYIYETPYHKLDIEYLKTITNADVRAVFIKKYGIDRLMDCYGTIMDSYTNYNNKSWTNSEYKLIDMAKAYRHGNINVAPYLYMKNQTTGMFHIEAIDPVCRTLPEAIVFRYPQLKGLDIANLEVDIK